MRSIVEGMSEEAWHTSVVPSGWTPAGFVEHLGGAEYHWFQQVIAGKGLRAVADEKLTPYDPFAAFTSDLSSEEVLRGYRVGGERSDEVIAGVSMFDRPRGRHFDNEVPSVRWSCST